MAYSRLRRNSAQRKALLRDLVTDLILNGRIETTVAKAKELKRLVDATWTEAAYTEQYHPVDLILECTDRNNLLVDIMNTLTQHKVQVLDIHASRNTQTLTSDITMSIQVKDANHLIDVMNIIRNVSSVYDVKRTSRN